MSITLDNECAQALDDAIHVRQLNNDEFEMGIHCTDYPISVCPENREEFEAAYAKGVKHQHHLLSTTKTQQYSLKVGRMSPTFSLISVFSLRRRCVLRVSYGSTLIRVHAQLTFAELDSIISGRVLPSVKEKTVCDQRELVQYIQKLNDLAKNYLSSRPKSANEIIKSVTEDINIYLARELKGFYGNYSFTKPLKGAPDVSTISFRSPLRKFFDLCTLRQLEAFEKKMDVEDMMRWVAGDEHMFLRILHDYQQA